MGHVVRSRYLGEGEAVREKTGTRREQEEELALLPEIPAEASRGLSAQCRDQYPCSCLHSHLCTCHPTLYSDKTESLHSADRPRVLLFVGLCTCCSFCMKHSFTPSVWQMLCGPSCLSFPWEAFQALKWVPLHTLCLPGLLPFPHRSLLPAHLSVCPLPL